MTTSSADAMILRVVGHIISLPTEEQSTEVSRVRRYARLYDKQISDDVKTYIEQSEFVALYQHLFPVVHPQLIQQNTQRSLNSQEIQPKLLSVFEEGKVLVETIDDPIQVETVESIVDAETSTVEATELAEESGLSEASSDEIVSVVTEKDTSEDANNDSIPATDSHAEIHVDGVNKSENQSERAVLTEDVEGVKSKDVAVKSKDVAVKSKDVEKVEGEESTPVVNPTKNIATEIPWSNSFYNKLLRRYRAPRRSKREYRDPPPSRWDFWHRNAGLLSLSKWLEQSEFAGLWKSMFAHTIEGLERHGVHTVADLILKAPVEYEKFPFSSIDRSIVEGEATLRGHIRQRYVEVDAVLKRWTVVLEGKENVTLTCSWVGTPPRGWEKWQTGAMVGFAGVVELADRLEMHNPEPIGLDGRGSGLLANYALEGIEDLEIRNLVATLLQQVLLSVQDSLPKEVLEDVGLLSLEDALREAHFPSNQNYRGRSRLAFEEIFLYHIGKRLNSKFTAINGSTNKIQHGALAHFAWVNNIELSDAQEEVLSEIRRDMLSSNPMRRLLQGDVGSGKPMVALFAALSLFDLNPKGKGKSSQKPLVVYVCNDDLSAERRFIFVEGAFKMLGIQCKLMTHKPNKAEFSILESEGGMVVVTDEILRTRLQALPNVRLVIVEEIQDFGNTIPYGYLKRSPSPDLLVFTPAPQPIHVLETVYSDFALSTVSDDDRLLPQSHWVQAKDREQTYAKLHKLIEEGRQGLIIWPVVNGKDSIDIKQALQMAGAIQGRYLPDVRIAVYCSSMRKDERLKVFEEFQNKRIDVLLCTTIIEDTPSVGNTTMIIVEKAEVSNVMRLHRLRGHLSSSNYPSFCTYVVSDEASENSIGLVQQVCDEPNGFALAEWLADETDGLKLRWADQDEVKVRGEARQMAHLLSLKELRRCRWPLLNNAVRNWWSEFDTPEQNVPNRKRKRYKGRR